MHPKITLYARPRADMTSWLQMVDYCVEKGIKNLETLSVFELAAPDVEFAKKLKAYADEKGVKIVCVSVGGELMGVAGMFLMIPIASVLYTLCKEVVNHKLADSAVDAAKLEPQPPELKSPMKVKREKRKLLKLMKKEK